MIFKCLDCGGDALEVRVIDATLDQNVYFDKNGHICYGFAKIEDHFGMRYKCRSCGATLNNSDGSIVSTEDELIEWLKAHQ